MSDRLPPIVVSAEDRASDKFRDVARAAQKMGPGSYVQNAPATRAAGHAGRGGGGVTIIVNAPIKVVANDPLEFSRAIQRGALGSARR